MNRLTPYFALTDRQPQSYQGDLLHLGQANCPVPQVKGNEMGFDMPRDEPVDREEYEKWEREQPHVVGEYWICCGPCGQWKRGMAAAHNGSGPVCNTCEEKK